MYFKRALPTQHHLPTDCYCCIFSHHFPTDNNIALVNHHAFPFSTYWTSRRRRDVGINSVRNRRFISFWLNCTSPAQLSRSPSHEEILRRVVLGGPWLALPGSLLLFFDAFGWTFVLSLCSLQSLPLWGKFNIFLSFRLEHEDHNVVVVENLQVTPNIAIF